MGNDTIDWKKIGNPKSAPVRAAHSPDNSPSSVATPQRPTIPVRSAAVLRHSKGNINYHTKAPAVKAVPHKQQQQNAPYAQKAEAPVRKNHSDLGGMEMLDTDFILDVIENLQETEQTDIAMRKIGFSEILRRGLESMIDSRALRVYAIDADLHYGRHIKCQAMQELARRTA